jgi:hypothetical protein
VDEDLARLWGQVKHHRLVVQLAQEELVFVTFVVQAARKTLGFEAAHFFGGGLLVVVFRSVHEHL